MDKVTYVKAELLTPFHYNHLPIAGGSSTLPHLVTDTSIMFGLASVMGFLSRSLVLNNKADYKNDISKIPVKSSLFKRIDVDGIPNLMDPLVQRFSINDEFFSWRNFKLNSKLSGSGMFKEFFYIQQVPQGAIFEGSLYGIDPFELFNKDEIVIRIGINRSGMLKLTKIEKTPIHINASTANLFTENKYEINQVWLSRIHETKEINEKDFIQEVSQWN